MSPVWLRSIRLSSTAACKNRAFTELVPQASGVTTRYRPPSRPYTYQTILCGYMLGVGYFGIDSPRHQDILTEDYWWAQSCPADAEHSLTVGI